MAIVKIKGLRQLGEAMSKLSADVAKKAGHAAVSAGATVIKKAAKANAPVAPEAYEVEGNLRTKVKVGKRTKRVKSTTTVLVQPGNIGRQIITKRLRTSQTRLTSEYIVAVRGKAEHGFASRIASLQEFGTVKMRAQPFLRPAFEDNQRAAVDAIKERLAKRIDAANKGKK